MCDLQPDPEPAPPKPQWWMFFLIVAFIVICAGALHVLYLAYG